MEKVAKPGPLTKALRREAAAQAERDEFEAAVERRALELIEEMGGNESPDPSGNPVRSDGVLERENPVLGDGVSQSGIKPRMSQAEIAAQRRAKAAAASEGRDLAEEALVGGTASAFRAQSP